jgi:hypothetical protein
VVSGAEGGCAHVLIRGAVVLGCRGLWIIDPAALGMDRGRWEDWRGGLDAAFIIDEGDGSGYQPALYGDHVGGRVATYPEALAVLRAELGLAGPPAGAPGGWQTEVFYMARATGLIIKFPVPLAEVRQDWDRPVSPEHAAWYASLGPHTGVEALCLLCGQTCNPDGPGDMTHGRRDDGQPCGGPLVPLGAWGLPAPRQAGIPYACEDPDTGERTCPVCQQRIAEDHSPDGERLTSRYAGHYQREHGKR